MAKVVIAKLKPKSTALREKRVVGADGRVKLVPTLDAASITFGDELQSVFARNVRKARRDNKRVVGSADVAPRKA